MSARRFTWLALVPVAGLCALVSAGLAACSAADGHRGAAQPIDRTDATQRPTPTERPTSVVRNLAGSFKGYSTAKEVPAEFVGVVTPVAELEDFWQSGTAEVFVWSRWTVRVDEVVSGAMRPGDTFVMLVRGGWMDPDAVFSVATGVLTGSARPKPGESGVLVIYSEYPRLEIRRQELVFVRRFQDVGAKEEQWVLAVPNARFLVAADGTLKSPLPGAYQGINTFAQQLEGQPLSAVAAALQP